MDEIETAIQTSRARDALMADLNFHFNGSIDCRQARPRISHGVGGERGIMAAIDSGEREIKKGMLAVKNALDLYGWSKGGMEPVVWAKHRGTAMTGAPKVEALVSIDMPDGGWPGSVFEMRDYGAPRLE